MPRSARSPGWSLHLRPPVQQMALELPPDRRLEHAGAQRQILQGPNCAGPWPTNPLLSAGTGLPRGSIQMAVTIPKACRLLGSPLMPLRRDHAHRRVFLEAQIELGRHISIRSKSYGRSAASRCIARYAESFGRHGCCCLHRILTWSSSHHAAAGLCAQNSWHGRLSKPDAASRPENLTDENSA